jgi:hypothetical protein
VGDRRMADRRARLCSSQAIGSSVHSRVRRSTNSREPFRIRFARHQLSHGCLRSLRRLECRTADPANCQSNVKSVSFIFRTFVLAAEYFADLLQI